MSFEKKREEMKHILGKEIDSLPNSILLQGRNLERLKNVRNPFIKVSCYLYLRFNY